MPASSNRMRRAGRSVHSVAMGSDGVDGLLEGAELWERVARRPGEPPDVNADAQFLAGWEDGAPFCAAVCATDVGLAFCRACPTETVRRVLDRGSAAGGRCPAGV